MRKTQIQLSDHFTYQKLLRFVLPSIVMMVFTSIYGVVDGLFVSNFAGKTPFAAINLVMPFIMVLGGIGFMIGTGGTALGPKSSARASRRRQSGILPYGFKRSDLSSAGVQTKHPISKPNRRREPRLERSARRIRQPGRSLRGYGPSRRTG